MEEEIKKTSNPWFPENAKDVKYFLWSSVFWGFFSIASLSVGAGLYVHIKESYGLHLFSSSVALLITAIRWFTYGWSKRSLILSGGAETPATATSTATASASTSTSGTLEKPEFGHWMIDWVKSTLLYKYADVETLIRKSIQKQYFFNKIHPWLITIWDDLLLLILAVVLSFEYEKSRYWNETYGPAALSGCAMYIFANFSSSIVHGFFLFATIEENAYLAFWGLRKAFSNFWTILTTESWTRRDLPTPDKHAHVNFLNTAPAKVLDTFRKIKYLTSWFCSLTAFALYYNRVNDWAWVAGIGLSLAAVGLWLHAHILAWILYYKTYNTFTSSDDYNIVYPLHKSDMDDEKQTWTIKQSLRKIMFLWNPDPIILFFLFIFIVLPYGIPLLVEQPYPEHWARYLYVSTVAVLAYWVCSFGSWIITYQKTKILSETIAKRYDPVRMYVPWYHAIKENNLLMLISSAMLRRHDLPAGYLQNKSFKLVDKWRMWNYFFSWVSTLGYIPLFVFYSIDDTIGDYLAPALALLVSAVIFLLYAIQAELWIHKRIAPAIAAITPENEKEQDVHIIFPYKKKGNSIVFDEGHFTWFYSLPEVFLIGVTLAYNVYMYEPGVETNNSQWVSWAVLMVALYHQVVKTIIWYACNLPTPFFRFWWIFIYPFYTIWIPCATRAYKYYDAHKLTEEEKADRKQKALLKKAEQLAAEQARLEAMRLELEKRLKKETSSSSEETESKSADQVTVTVSVDAEEKETKETAVAETEGEKVDL